MVVVIVKVKLQTNLCFIGEGLLMGQCYDVLNERELEDKKQNKTIRKKAMAGLQVYFYNYYNHTLLPVLPVP